MTYCYACECGKRAVEVRPVREATFRPTCECGQTMDRDFTAEGVGGHLPSNWPTWSDTGGCHPDQIGEFSAILEKKGVHADFRPDGSIKWESKGHKKACCEAFKRFDRDGCYGDAKPC